MKNQINFALLIGSVLMLLGFLALPLGTSTQSTPWVQADLSGQFIPNRPGHPKLDDSLARLALGEHRVSAGLPGMAAREADMEFKNGMVRVVVESTPERFLQGTGSKPVRQSIEATGGRIELIHKNLHQSWVPIDSLLTLAESSSVSRIRLPMHPVPHEVISEGVSRIGASLYKALPAYHAGRKVKVAVLDLGFLGYKNLLGSELPSQVTARSFRTDGNLETPSSSADNNKHGSACAELIYDVMPDIDLYLANFGTDVEQHEAVTWLLNQGVEVISFSVGWTNAGAGDGTGPICYDVGRAHDQGVFWVNSAGNDAQDHWEGTFNDPDNDGWHNFSGGDEILNFNVHAYTPVSAFLNWNDWGTWTGSVYTGSGQDYDLYLYIWNGATWEYVDSSQEIQNGNQWPTEDISGWYGYYDYIWGVAIHRRNASQARKLELFIWGNSNPIEYNVPDGSLTVPADSPYAIAAGATSANNDAYHSYSSLGPTSDGRIKPDFASPSGVSTYTYGTQGFYGTSASAPHMAGALALLLGKTPYTKDQILQILQQRAVDLGPAGRDNMFGYGRLNVGR